MGSRVINAHGWIGTVIGLGEIEPDGATGYLVRWDNGPTIGHKAAELRSWPMCTPLRERPTGGALGPDESI